MVCPATVRAEVARLPRLIVALVALASVLIVLAIVIAGTGMAASHPTSVLAPGRPASERLTVNT